jgi:hypothetical protein
MQPVCNAAWAAHALRLDQKERTRKKGTNKDSDEQTPKARYEHLKESKVLRHREKQLKTRMNKEINEFLESRHYEYYEAK